MPEKDPIDELTDMIDKMSESDKNEMQKKLGKSIQQYEDRHEDAIAYGKGVGKRLVKKFRITEKDVYRKEGLRTDEASAAIASVLYQCYMEDQRADCGELLNKWINEKLWGRVVLDYIPTLQKIWQYLHDNKRTKNNRMGFGDADGDIWVEYPKQEKKYEDKRKIIIHRSHCTCADNNTHIFVFDSPGILGPRLIVNAVWPREYTSPRHRQHSWGDDRDIDIPSLNTFRKRNFTYGYRDFRDNCYVLSLEVHGGPRIEGAWLRQSEIQHALWLINYMRDITEHPDVYEC